MKKSEMGERQTERLNGGESRELRKRQSTKTGRRETESDRVLKENRKREEESESGATSEHAGCSCKD